MKVETHALPAATPGTQRTLVSWHFGAPSEPSTNRKKAYIQASLHADEWPAMLVAQHLKRLLTELEASGAITGEIVLVPAANPIGLAQRMQGHAFGRFDFANGQNFNRGYPHITHDILRLLSNTATHSAQEYIAAVRAAASTALSELRAAEAGLSETAALKYTLMSLACDADIALDLHCDHEAVMHLYAHSAQAATGTLLAQLLGAQALLVAEVSGDNPFDEALSRPWAELQTQADAARHPERAMGCFATTVELRGQTDMTHAEAARDAAALIEFLAHQQLITKPLAALPAALCLPTPLSAVEPLVAPHGGMVVHLQPLGAVLKAGDPVAEIIDPFTSQSSVVHARFGGRLFARDSNRFVAAGARLAKIAGDTPFRSGKLLGE